METIKKGVGVPETAVGVSSPDNENKTRILDKSLGRRVKPQPLKWENLQKHLEDFPKPPHKYLLCQRMTSDDYVSIEVQNL